MYASSSGPSGSSETNTKPCQTASRTGRRPNVLEAELVEVLGVLGPDQPAVEVVDPGVVRALEADGLAARLFDHRRAPVLADVVEGAQDAVPGADDHERLAQLLRQEVRSPASGASSSRPDADPVAQEPVVALERPDRLVVVGPPGQERGSPERPAYRLDLLPLLNGRHWRSSTANLPGRV